jgi:hypothetical protein
MQNPQNLFPHAGSYNVRLIATNDLGCSDTSTVNSYVTVKEKPFAKISVSSSEDIDNQSTVFNHSEGGSDCVLYFGDGDYLMGYEWTSANHNYSNDGEYTLTQIITNSEGCMDTSVVHTYVELNRSFYIPNAFTPGGKNPIFLPVILYGDASTYVLKVFNRWGQMVFETKDLGEGWDGTSTTVQYSSAAAAGKLLGLNAERLANALAIAGSNASTLAEVRRGEELTPAKGSAEPMAARNGTFAALLARAGLSYPLTILEGANGYGKMVTGSLDETVPSRRKATI